MSRALLALCLCVALAGAQESGGAEAEEAGPTGDVQVDAVADDAAIARRLERILAATGWFRAVEVDVDQGVVSLGGVADHPDHRDWATALARRTEDVVAVANHLRVEQPFRWSFEPAWEALRELRHDLVGRLPLVLFGLLVLALTWLAARAARRVARPLLGRRIENPLLLQVAGTAVLVPVVLIGLYVFLHVAGLTRLAVTVLGGTGLFGLVVGIAFRDIAENFLASLLISVKRPFTLGDLIEVQGTKGYVQSVTTRGTLLMTLEGNHTHVPNSIVYKSTIVNFSANPSTRFDVALGVDYADSLAAAQETCLGVLREHAAVLDDPEPLVLVEDLASSAVSLRLYFWVDTHRHSGLKVRSSVIRRVKRAVQCAGLTLPDDAREVIFPQGVPLGRPDGPDGDGAPAREPRRAQPEPAEEELTTSAEGDLASEYEEILEQAQAARDLDLGPDLLRETRPPPP